MMTETPTYCNRCGNNSVQTILVDAYGNPRLYLCTSCGKKDVASSSIEFSNQHHIQVLDTSLESQELVDRANAEQMVDTRPNINPEGQDKSDARRETNIQEENPNVRGVVELISNKPGIALFIALLGAFVVIIDIVNFLDGVLSSSHGYLLLFFTLLSFIPVLLIFLSTFYAQNEKYKKYLSIILALLLAAFFVTGVLAKTTYDAWQEKKQNPSAISQKVNENDFGFDYNESVNDINSCDLLSRSGIVFHDDNRNKLQDNSEPGLPGVTVTLRGVGGYPKSADITDSNGRYEVKINNPPPGIYVLEAQIPPGYQIQTTENSRLIDLQHCEPFIPYTGTPVSTLTHVNTATPSAMPSVAPTAISGNTVTQTSTALVSETPTNTPSLTATLTSTRDRTPTLIITSSPTITSTPTSTTVNNPPTVTQTSISTGTPTGTPTITVPDTPLPIYTPTPTSVCCATHPPRLTHTPTPSTTPNGIPTHTATAVSSPTPTQIGSVTPTPPHTHTPTNTPTSTPTATNVSSQTPTLAWSSTPTGTLTRIVTNTPTPTYTATVSLETPTYAPTSTPTPVSTEEHEISITWEKNCRGWEVYATTIPGGAELEYLPAQSGKWRNKNFISVTITARWPDGTVKIEEIELHRIESCENSTSTSTPAPSDTSIPLTATPAPPTETPVPPTGMPVPPTSTPVPPTSTPIPTGTPAPTRTPHDDDD